VSPITFRERALSGKIPGVIKPSWYATRAAAPPRPAPPFWPTGVASRFGETGYDPRGPPKNTNIRPP
jgi:hypothetical protein